MFSSKLLIWIIHKITKKAPSQGKAGLETGTCGLAVNRYDILRLTCNNLVTVVSIKSTSKSMAQSIGHINTHQLVTQ